MHCISLANGHPTHWASFFPLQLAHIAVKQSNNQSIMQQVLKYFWSILRVNIEVCILIKFDYQPNGHFTYYYNCAAIHPVSVWCNLTHIIVVSYLIVVSKSDRLPEGFTQLSSLTHLSINDISMSRLPADIGW